MALEVPQEKAAVRITSVRRVKGISNMAKIKYGKIAAVIFLTVLIWVWADLQKTEEYTVFGAVINVAKSTNPNLWVSFNDEPSVSIKKIVLKGPSSKIANVKKMLRERQPILEFFLDIEQDKAMAGTDTYTVDVLNFLKKSDKIKGFGLAVTSCDPNTLDVKVVELVKKSLTVVCLDENGIRLKAESIDPPKIDMAAPQDTAVAYVLLNSAEEQQARRSPSPVLETPYIKLGGRDKYADTTVKVKLPPEEKLQEYEITPATVGIVFSPNLVGEYDVKLLNLTDMAMVSILATPAARSVYRQQPYQMLLYILDDDPQKGTERRKVVYNFPQEFVRKGEIKLKNPEQPAEAKFKLISLAPATETSP